MFVWIRKLQFDPQYDLGLAQARIAKKWYAASDWVALKVAEVRTWIRAQWRRFCVWLAWVVWEGLIGPLLDLFGRKDE